MRGTVGTLLGLLSALAPNSAYAQDSSGDFSCDDLVVAGAGPGGLYSAWRMIEAGLADPTKTCIFEQTQRVGKFVSSSRPNALVSSKMHCKKPSKIILTRVTVDDTSTITMYFLHEC